MDFKSRIREYIVNNFLFGDGGKIDDATSFLEKGIIDSTGVLEVVQYLEETWGIKINDDELLPENLDSVNNLAAFLERKTVQG